ncbi:MAG TPA: hypothetical protein VJ256_02275 [Dehalococcoidia bacterium]|nr:hypothetical protein [Dehalococcoidia bacterium]
MGTIEGGKQGELLVLGELLKRGAKVYVPLVDVEGIDAVLRRPDGSYAELQVKTAVRRKNRPRWFRVPNLEPRRNLYIVCVALREQEIWVIPSKEFHEYATHISVEKQGATLYDLDFGGASEDKLEKYRNAWQLIAGPTEAASEPHPVEAAFAEDWNSAEDSVYDAI